MIPVVLSGGSGTRLWPLSRSKTPKQFCHFFQQSLQEMTLDRVSQLASPWIMTNVALKDQTVRQMKKYPIPSSQLVLEPQSKNTAPAIAVICQILKAQGQQNEVVGIFPADHLVEKEQKFFAALHLAEEQARLGKVVTLGIEPDYPATGFGYIQVEGAAHLRKGEFSSFGVKCFHEKPDLKTAESFLKDGTYFWNAGIFIFRVDKMIEAFEKYQPAMWATVLRLGKDLRELEDVYAKLENISIDYAILEKLTSADLSCIPCDIGWNDIGSWDAIADVLSGSSNDVVEASAKGNFVHSSYSDKTYTFGGVDDLIVVDTKDAVLVTRKGQSQSVKDVVEILKLKNNALIKQHPDEERPWGRFEILKDTDKFKSKVIQVDAGQQISYQSHAKREEHWIIIRGVGEVILDDKVIPVKAGTYVKIPLAAKHRIRNTGTEMIEFVEVQMGTYFGEDDIVRYQDDYQRS